jgi:two-component system, chemotaxis family, CheB/CheR fusion protein
VVVLTLTGELVGVRPATWRSYLELVLVTIGVLVVGIPTFGLESPGPTNVPALLLAPLPFLIWAAVRLGVGGTSLTLLVVAGVAVVNAYVGRGPFIHQAPDVNVVSLQIFLTAICIPVLLLAAVVEERRQAEESLRRTGKQAELALAERTLQLALAGKAALVGSYAHDVGTDTIQIDEGYCALHGLPEGTVETTRSAWRARMHPDDRARVEDRRKRVFQQRLREYGTEYRIIRFGETRWIETRSFITYTSEGRPHRVTGVNIDITERKQAELALTEREAQLGLAGQAARVGSFVIDFATGKIQTSPGFAAIHGLAETSEELTCEKWRACVFPGDLAHFEALRSRALAEQRRELNIEYRVVGADGEARWIESRSLVSYDDHGRPARMVGVHIDITERKRAVDRLQESERKLRDLLGALPAAIYVTDAAGHITYCNQSAVDLWGSKPELGRDKWSELVKYYHADGSPMALANCPTEVALKHGRIVREQEAIIERKDGTRIPIIPYPTPLRDETGTVVGVVNMTVDISKRKKAELLLADQTAQLALAGKAALVGNFAYDADSEQMQISEGYAAIHGFPDGTTEIARRVWQLGLPPEECVRLEEIRSRCFRERLAEYDVDYRIVRSGGEVRWIDARCFVSYHGDGRPKRVVGVNIDITERKRAEEHLQAMNAELDHRVKNVLATASAVATQTLNASSSSEQFVSAFEGRLRSMAQTHELLSERLWRGVPLAELLRRELAPYAGGNNTEIGGPEVILTAEAGQTLAMVFHELATNAAKHGAFSARDGKVSVEWRQQLNGNAGTGLVIEWQETGGLPAKAENKAGYGINVIRELIPHELAGKVDHVLTPEGACCQLEIPGRWIDASSPVERTFNWRHEEAAG